MTAAGVVAVDTSVAVPLLVAGHQQHALVSGWARDRTLCLSGHNCPIRNGWGVQAHRESARTAKP